jgi:hypothetical protein
MPSRPMAHDGAGPSRQQRVLDPLSAFADTIGAASQRRFGGAAGDRRRSSWVVLLVEDTEQPQALDTEVS